MHPNMNHYVTQLLVVVFCSAGAFAGDSNRGGKISGFDLGSVRQVNRSADPGSPQPVYSSVNKSPRRSVGSVVSPEGGIGVGVSVDLTYDDA